MLNRGWGDEPGAAGGGAAAVHVGDEADLGGIGTSRIVGQRPSRRRLPRHRAMHRNVPLLNWRDSEGAPVIWLGNQIGDEGAVALAEAAGKGALGAQGTLTSTMAGKGPQGRVWPRALDAGSRDSSSAKQIGDEGAVDLAEAVGKGALPELTQLHLSRNELSETAKDAKEVVEAKRSGLRVHV